MKIITDNKIYVQKNDFIILNQSNLPIPASIFMKVFGNGITITDDSNRFEFIEFTEQEEIEYFRNIDWIIDYNEVKDLSESEMIALGQIITEEKNTIAKEFNTLSEEDKKQNMSMVHQYQLLDYKIYSLRDIICYQQGHIKFKLPEEIGQTNEPTKKKHGFKKLLRLIMSQGSKTSKIK